MDKGKHEIRLGDRIFASIVQGSRVIVELVLESVADMREVMVEIMRQTSGDRGVATMRLRNATRGWRMEKALMLRPRPVEMNF